ncbi:MAG: alkaline phosphatase D [Paraglaciecola psychrophila]
MVRPLWLAQKCVSFFGLISDTGELFMKVSITRRQALVGLSIPFIIPAALSDNTPPQPTKTAFIHGLASGDPKSDSVVIWTRVSGFENSVTVKWRLSTTPEMTTIVAAGNYIANQVSDYTVKVVPSKLTAGTVYFYQFEVAGEISATARTRTLPAGAVANLGLAVVSCSNYPFGYFNVYEAIALDPSIQFVVHLGDYIYEYGPKGFGGAVGEALARAHQPAYEIQSLADYRQRHGQYKADPQSQMMHAAHPLIAIWDDHETTNNPWTGGAQNHQHELEGSWLVRRDASLQAYFEWMPIREPAAGTRSIDYWRNYKFGDLANLITLETRHTARAQQISYSDHRELLADESAAGATMFLQEIVGDPSRQMLSTDMETFLQQSLIESVSQGQIWRLLANPIPMARTRAPRLPAAMLSRLKSELPAADYARAVELATLGELDLPLYLDPWDGYPSAREAFYSLCRKAGVSDLVVVTGDSHSFWENVLFDDKGRSMGVELGTNGVTSPGDFLTLGAQGAAEMDDLLARCNDEVVWTNGQHNGYIRLLLTAKTGRADYIAISNVGSRDYAIELLRSVVLKPA